MNWFTCCVGSTGSKPFVPTGRLSYLSQESMTPQHAHRHRRLSLSEPDLSKHRILLYHIIRDKQLGSALRTFAISKKAGEVLLFLDDYAVHSPRRTIEFMIAKYLTTNAPFELNLASETKDRFFECMGRGERDFDILFAPIERECVVDMQHSSVFREFCLRVDVIEFARHLSDVLALYTLIRPCNLGYIERNYGTEDTDIRIVRFCAAVYGHFETREIDLSALRKTQSSFLQWIQDKRVFGTHKLPLRGRITSFELDEVRFQCLEYLVNNARLLEVAHYATQIIENAG